MSKKEDEDKKFKELMKKPEYQAMYAKQYVSPLAQNANVILQLANKEEPLAYEALANEMEKQVKAVHENDLSRLEEMLICQAQTLDRVFAKLIASGLSSEYLNSYKVKTDLALKTQRQCRATLETLALIKNPQPYVRQQNVAVNQQVNNAAPAPPEGNKDSSTRAPAPAREKNSNSTNGLLTDKRGEYETLDIGGTPTTGGIDKELATVAALNGSADA